MLTGEQRTRYERDGYIKLHQAFDPERVAAIADRVWTHLETHKGIRRDDSASWNVPGPWVGLKVLKEEELFLSLDSRKLRGAIDDLLGSGAWQRPRHWGGFLLNFPDCRPEQWNVPAAGWHVDFHYTNEPGTAFGLRVFTFLCEVGPRGGGTLFVRGSHRLVERFVRGLAPAERRRKYSALKATFNASHPWLRELTSAEGPARVSRFMDRTREIDGVQVRVEQLCGSPGDVVLSHPWMLHASSQNAGTGPRLMLAKLIHTERSAEVSAPA